MNSTSVIVVWLGSLGLGRYQAAFRENETDETLAAASLYDDAGYLRAVEAVFRIGKRYKKVVVSHQMRAEGEDPQ